MKKFSIQNFEKFYLGWLFGGTVPPGKKLFGGTVPPGKNYLEVPQHKCLVISWEFSDTFRYKAQCIWILMDLSYSINVGHYRITCFWEFVEISIDVK